MIAAPITADPETVADVSTAAIGLAIKQPLSERCSCPSCGSTSLRLLGLGAVDGKHISLLSEDGTHSVDMTMDRQPMTLCIVATCVFGHQFSTVLRQVGSEVHQATWLPN